MAEMLATMTQVAEQKWRILIVDNKPDQVATHVRNLELWGYEVHAAQGQRETLLQDARRLACERGCHLALVDMRLFDDRNPSDLSGFALVEDLSPLPVFIISNFGSLQKASQAISKAGARQFIGKEEGPRRLRSAIEEFFKEYCPQSEGRPKIVWFREWQPEQIASGLFDKTTPVRPWEIECVVRQLFSDKAFDQVSQLRFSAFLGATRTLDFYSLRHSAVFKVNAAGLQPTVVKIAPAPQIQAEYDNYVNHIWHHLPDTRHSHIQQHVVVGYAGGILYGFLGAAAGGLRTLADRYDEMPQEEINKCVSIFFENTWITKYQQKTLSDKSLFQAYADAWGNKWIEQIQSFPLAAPDITFVIGDLHLRLPNPITWLLEQVDQANGNSADATNAIIHYTAVTHGDLHCRNIFVDQHNEPWISDYERTKLGPILRDFVELELDFLQHELEVPSHDNRSLLSLFLCMLKPSQFDSETALRSDTSDLHKLAAIIGNLRRLAFQVAQVSEAQQYYWSLLFDIVLTLTLIRSKARHPDDQTLLSFGTAPDSVVDLDASAPSDRPFWYLLLLGGLISHRLDYWEKPWPPRTWPKSKKAQETGGESMNYERGLVALKQQAAGTDWSAAFDLLEARLRENLQEERDYGPSPQTKQDRARIVKELNALSSSHLGLSFTDLCMGKKPSASAASSDGGQTVMDMLQRILSEIKQGRQEDQETASLILDALAQNRIEQTEAAKIAADLQAWAQKIEQEGMPLNPELKTAVDALTEHSGSAYQYLQVALPIIPGILTYNVELGSQHQANLRSIWQQIKGRLAKNRDGPQGKDDMGSSPVSSPVINSGKAWALLVGVDHYDDKFIPDLDVCVADVTALQQSLADDYEVTSLLTDATPEHLPTRARILGQLSVVAQAAGEGDLLLFFFSGHGVSEAGESYLLPRDAEIAALEQTAVSMRDVRKLMDKSPARAKVIVLDACHSGAAIGKDGLVMTQEFIRRVFEEAEGIVVLASCKQGQKSWPWAEKGRSVFTYYLLEALEGRADLDKKGFVTVNDVSRYVTDGVKYWAANAGVPQTPTLHSIVVGDIVLRRHSAPGAKLA